MTKINKTVGRVRERERESYTLRNKSMVILTCKNKSY